jgi:hypothetical protein
VFTTKFTVQVTVLIACVVGTDKYQVSEGEGEEGREGEAVSTQALP